MANKSRILFLLKYLQQHSDEEHSMTTADLRAVLDENGFPITIQTLRNDIATLKESGFDIRIDEGAGISTSYTYVDRDWDAPELQVLIDAVSSCQFLTAEKSKALIERLIGLAGPSERKTLKPSILVSENIKAENNHIFLNVQAIREGIDMGRKIRFQYFNYNPDMEKIYRNNGEVYVVSPYATVWNDDRYYLVGWSDKREKVVVFRVDRIDFVTVTEEQRVPEPEGFSIQNYADKVFSMFDGPETDVTLRCDNSLMDQVIDKFGKQIQPENKTARTFDIKVPVSLSGTFFSWVFQYAGKMTVIKPETAGNWYVEMLQQALDDALGIDT